MTPHETTFWHREAKRRHARETLDAIQVACFPHMKTEDREELIARLEDIALTDAQKAARLQKLREQQQANLSFVLGIFGGGK